MKPLEKIIVVGGGTAGWLTSFLLSKHKPNIKCLTIDSSKLGSIGVGEGTTGVFLDVLQQAGLDLDEIIRETDALPKYGINFTDWGKQPGSFISPIDGSYTDNSIIVDLLFFGALKNNIDVDDVSRFASLIKFNKTDLYLDQTQKVKNVFGNPALHLDTFKTINYLKKKSLALGTKHIDSEINKINLNERGDIHSVSLANGDEITGDLFIDCTGFSKILMKELDAEWIDYSNHLPVNTGMPFILENDNFKKNLYTTAHAMDNGWLWEIPTRNRIGRGYVYSDQFASEDDIIKELETKFQTGVKPVKSIKFNSGRLENVWIKNCVAIGLSAAFLEPLQATSIHCSIVQIKDLLLTCLNSTVENTLDPIVVKNYNNRMSKLYSHMTDFVSMHYSGGRVDTKFWNNVTNNLSRTPRAEELIHLSKLRLTRSFDFDVHDGYAGQWLWNYSLNGLGHFSKDTIDGFFNNSTVDTNEIDNIVKMYLKDTIENISYTYDLQTLNEKLQRDKE